MTSSFFPNEGEEGTGTGSFISGGGTPTGTGTQSGTSSFSSGDVFLSSGSIANGNTLRLVLNNGAVVNVDVSELVTVTSEVSGLTFNESNRQLTLNASDGRSFSVTIPEGESGGGPVTPGVDTFVDDVTFDTNTNTLTIHRNDNITFGVSLQGIIDEITTDTNTYLNDLSITNNILTASYNDAMDPLTLDITDLVNSNISLDDFVSGTATNDFVITSVNGVATWKAPQGAGTGGNPVESGEFDIDGSSVPTNLRLVKEDGSTVLIPAAPLVAYIQAQSNQDNKFVNSINYQHSNTTMTLTFNNGDAPLTVDLSELDNTNENLDELTDVSTDGATGEDILVYRSGAGGTLWRPASISSLLAGLTVPVSSSAPEASTDITSKVYVDTEISNAVSQEAIARGQADISLEQAAETYTDTEIEALDAELRAFIEALQLGGVSVQLFGTFSNFAAAENSRSSLGNVTYDAATDTFTGITLSNNTGSWHVQAISGDNFILAGTVENSTTPIRFNVLSAGIQGPKGDAGMDGTSVTVMQIPTGAELTDGTNTAIVTNGMDGAPGPQGPYEVSLYQQVPDSESAPLAPTATWDGTNFGNLGDWMSAFPGIATGMDTYRSFAEYAPSSNSLGGWATPFEVSAEGPAGPSGPIGPPPAFSMTGTASALATTEAPTVAISGAGTTDDNYVVAIGVPAGAKGDKGDLITTITSGPPASPDVGDIWIDTDDGVESTWDGTQWFQSGGPGVTSNATGGGGGTTDAVSYAEAQTLTEAQKETARNNIDAAGHLELDGNLSLELADGITISGSMFPATVETDTFSYDFFVTGLPQFLVGDYAVYIQDGQTEYSIFEVTLSLGGSVAFLWLDSGAGTRPPGGTFTATMDMYRPAGNFAAVSVTGQNVVGDIINDIATSLQFEGGELTVTASGSQPGTFVIGVEDDSYIVAPFATTTVYQVGQNFTSGNKLYAVTTAPTADNDRFADVDEAIASSEEILDGGTVITNTVTLDNDWSVQSTTDGLNFINGSDIRMRLTAAGGLLVEGAVTQNNGPIT